MVNDLIDGISVQLNKSFGSEKRIYSETVEQGLTEPCFFIAVLNPLQTQIVGNRYFRQHPFDIHFFPEKPDNNEEIQGVASKLFDTLEYITLLNGDLVRGSEMRFEKVDGVLHFFVQFNLFIKKPTTMDPMGTVTINNDVKG